MDPARSLSKEVLRTAGDLFKNHVKTRINYRVFPPTFQLLSNEFWLGLKIERNGHHHRVTVNAQSNWATPLTSLPNCLSHLTGVDGSNRTELNIDLWKTTGEIVRVKIILFVLGSSRCNGNGAAAHLADPLRMMKKVVIYLQKGLLKIKQSNKLFGRKQEQEPYIATDEILFV